MAIEAGQQLLHYRLTEQIGEGGMRGVWKAVDTTLDREVAIKVLLETLAADAESLAWFVSLSDSTKSYATPWDLWTLLETLDKKGGRRFKKARNAALTRGPPNPLASSSGSVEPP